MTDFPIKIGLFFSSSQELSLKDNREKGRERERKRTRGRQKVRKREKERGKERKFLN